MTDRGKEPVKPLIREIMVAIQPQWAELIFIGSKTMEIRKTLPNNRKPFRAYVYVTEKRPLWIRFDTINQIMSGHVVGEFVCNGFDRFFWRDQSELVKEIRAKSQVSRDELARYAGDSDTLFAWHISDVVEYDNVKKIGEFLNNKGNIMKRPPQSWEYVTPYRFGG